MSNYSTAPGVLGTGAISGLYNPPNNGVNLTSPYLQPAPMAQLPDFTSTQNALSLLSQQIRGLNDHVGRQELIILDLKQAINWMVENPGRNLDDHDTFKRVDAEFTKAAAGAAK